MNRKPKVGEIVMLNNKGLTVICGLTSWEMVKQASFMNVTGISENLGTEKDPFWSVDVDQPLISPFLFTNRQIDLIPTVTVEF